VAKVQVELMISANKRLWWQEEWEHMTLVEVQPRDQHATSIGVQLFAIKEREKEFTLFMEIHEQKYEIMEAKLDTLFFFGSQIVECSMESTQSSTHIPISFVGSTHHVPSHI
jgi:hypothetical protein